MSDDQQGIAVSAYGKVIKQGWDWLGIHPQHPTRLSGVVEVPKLTEILTTNKVDFQRGSKYNGYKKAIEVAIIPVLRELGEMPEPPERRAGDRRPLEREIQRVLGDMLSDFPELSSLLGRRGRGEATTGILPEPNSPLVGVVQEGVDAMTGSKGGAGEGAGVEITPGEMPGERLAEHPEPTERGQPHEGRRRGPSIFIRDDEQSDRNEMGWLLDDTIFYNKGHPAYHRMERNGGTEAYIVVTVAWVLSRLLGEGSSPQDFINRFLAIWGGRP